ncbi:MAG: DNA polymerase I [Endomicrobium sp.]|jgi:DNA polymerase-1|nr:DNA polymerase I [Endomicrobium sp.]
MKKFYIIDGNAYIHRAYHALPPLSTSYNQQVNAVYGFIKLLLKIKNTFKPDYIAVCFDYPAKNFRHDIFPEYKAHRKPLDEALISQMPIAREAVKALNIVEIEEKGYEADDLIAAIAKNNKKEKIETVIVTGDKDILQLVENDYILVWNDSKDIKFDEEKVEEKFGVRPKQLADVFALMGDASDNVAGVKGIGEKTAVKLIKEYGTLENVLKNVKSIKGNMGKLLDQGKEDAIKSKKLVELTGDIGIVSNKSEEAYANKELDLSKALSFFKKYEFNSLIDKFCGKTGEKELSAKKEEIREDEYGDIQTETVTSSRRAAEVAKEIEESGIFALKTVGSSADSLKAQIVGVSVCIKNKVFYIPVCHNDFISEQIGIDEFKKIFSHVLSSEKVKKTGHDLKHERNIYALNGIEMHGIYFDIMLASYCLNPAKPHDMLSMSKEYLNSEAGDDSYLRKASKKILPADSSIEQTAHYANSISFCAYRIFKLFEREIKDKKISELFYNIEMPLLKILSEMEIAGIKVDTEFLGGLDKKTSCEVKNIENNIYKISGEEFNINSPKQLSAVMFEKLNLPVIKKTKTGYSTDEEVLNELSSYEFASEILKFRELQKLKSTYIDPIREYCLYYGGRIHTIFNQAVTTTGRLSSTEPNLQNIPIKSEYGREFRKVFVPERNKIFISADYSQIDLRVLAHISADKKLIEAFKRGYDIHAATAREVFNIADGQPLSDNLRSAAKSINFGIVYGMSPFGLSKQLNIAFAKAKEYIDGYFVRYGGVKKWMEKIVEDATENGYVSTITGRVRYMPELKSSNVQIRAAGERMAMNTPIQGTSADIIKIAMINIYNEIKVNKLHSLMLLQVHDDLLFEVPQDEKDIMIKIIKNKMENAVNLSVPLVVDVKIGKNWGEMKK